MSDHLITYPIHRRLNNWFGEAEEINGADRCTTYLFRWVIGEFSYFDLRTRRMGRARTYLHHIVGNDWSRDLHDHPKRFISFGVFGSYLEETLKGKRRFRAPWLRTFPAEHKHRLTTPWGPCWTIVIVLETEREWGFWPDGRFVPWRSYVYGADSDLADKAKDCP